MSLSELLGSDQTIIADGATGTQLAKHGLTFSVPPQGENRLLFAINKWLIVHPDAKGLVDDGAYPGMVGDDIIVKPV